MCERERSSVEKRIRWVPASRRFFRGSSNGVSRRDSPFSENTKESKRARLGAEEEEEEGIKRFYLFPISIDPISELYFSGPSIWLKFRLCRKKGKGGP